MNQDSRSNLRTKSVIPEISYRGSISYKNLFGFAPGKRPLLEQRKPPFYESTNARRLMNSHQAFPGDSTPKRGQFNMSRGEMVLLSFVQ